jgi:hypothetical protein
LNTHGHAFDEQDAPVRLRIAYGFLSMQVGRAKGSVYGMHRGA